MAVTKHSDRTFTFLFLFRILFIHSVFHTVYKLIGGVEGHAQGEIVLITSVTLTFHAHLFVCY